jgi:hypothetical protein
MSYVLLIDDDDLFRKAVLTWSTEAKRYKRVSWAEVARAMQRMISTRPSIAPPTRNDMDGLTLSRRS